MATNSCVSKLGRDIMNDCTEPYGKGIEKTFYVFDREDVDFGEAARTGDTVEWTMRDGTRGYKLMNPSSEVPAITKTDNNPVIGTSWDKVLPFTLLANSPENAEAIRVFKTGRFIIVYEHTVKGTDGKSAFHVIGYEVGAVGVDNNADTSSDDSQGGWTGTLVEKGAPSPDIFFFKTDYATTKAALESMCSTATSGV